MVRCLSVISSFSFLLFFIHLQSNELFSRAALHCLSTLTLRSIENSQALFDVGAAETIVETMKLHPSSRIVQVFDVKQTLLEWLEIKKNVSFNVYFHHFFSFRLI